MLEMRPNCECCDRDLSPTSSGAMICSFECTFCAMCASDVLKSKCPNCGGGLFPRPTRDAKLLAKFPASTTRKVKAQGCAAAE